MTIRPLRLFFDWWCPRYKRRVAEHLAQRCPTGASILDVGCNDGFVAAAMLQHKPDLSFQGVDIQDLHNCCIPKVVYDGQKLPFDDDSFDVVMAVDVLHHTPDIGVVLREMARVSRRFVLIKDHVVKGPISRWAVGTGDWLSNVPYGIECVYNYPTMQGWEQLFSDAGLARRELSWGDLGRLANTKQNPFFLLEKIVIKLPAAAKTRSPAIAE